jgi:HEAT repeat protein
LDDLTTKLQKGKTAKDKVTAAEAIGKMGDDGSKAAGQLCAALLDLTPSVRVAAIEAIEKVRPDLYKPLVVIITGTDAKATSKDQKKIIAAVNELGLLGEKATPTVPVLLTKLRAELAAGKVTDFTEMSLYYRSSVSGACFEALEKIAPNDAETQKIILALAGPTTRHAAARASAIKAAGRMGQADPSFRKKAVPVIAAGLSITDKANHIQLEAIQALGQFGKDATDALPPLKKLKLSSDEKVREAATAAIDKIESDK